LITISPLLMLMRPTCPDCSVKNRLPLRLSMIGVCGPRAAGSLSGYAWAIGYNALALPIAAGVFQPWGLTLRPEIAAISMSGSSIIVAVNALALKRLKLPQRDAERS
jgi:hypothetical protein